MRRALGTLAACVALWRPWSLGRGRAGVPQHLSWGAWYGIPNIGYTIHVYGYVFIYLLSIYLFLLAYIYIYNTYSHYSLHSETYPLMMYMYTSGLFMQYYISVYFNGITLHMSIKAYP